MSRSKRQPAGTFDARPLQPPSTAATAWVAADRKLLAFRLGNKASLEEITGSPDPKNQRWRWRVCKFGGETAIVTSRDAAARAAEFALGVGEMPFVLPETKVAKQSQGGAV